MKKQVEPFVFDTMTDLYPYMSKYCFDHGTPFCPRGEATRELRPVSFTLMQPQRSLYMGKLRRLNYRFFAIETLGYIAGLANKPYMDLLCDANSQMGKFRRNIDGGLAGAYGPPIRSSLVAAAEELASDIDSRRCVLSIWSPGLDSMKLNNAPNLPCTCLLHFYRNPQNVNMQDNSLGLQVYMRSNDLDWGVPYDVPAFCAIQVLMASCLQVPLAPYHHTAGSLHVYESHLPRVDRNESTVTSSINGFIPCYEILHADNAKENMRHAVDEAFDFIDQLYIHRIQDKKPFTTFKAEMATSNPWWKFWQDCINFKWEKSS